MIRKLTVAGFALLLISGCSSSKNTESGNGAQSVAKSGPKPAQYETGRTAFQRMYISARGWAADVKPFSLQSQFTADAPTSEGRAGLWRGSFGSPAKRMLKLFVWSGLAGPDAPEPGISFSAEDSWNPSNPSARVFDLAFLKIDSDKAYEVAQQHGGEKLIRKDPHQPVFFVLSWGAQDNELVWHVIYGISQDESTLRIAVNATSGEFVRVEK